MFLKKKKEEIWTSRELPNVGRIQTYKTDQSFVYNERALEIKAGPFYAKCWFVWFLWILSMFGSPLFFHKERERERDDILL